MDGWMDGYTDLVQLKVLVEDINREGLVKEGEDLSLCPSLDTNPGGKGHAPFNIRRFGSCIEDLLGRNAEVNTKLRVKLHEYFRLCESVDHIHTKGEPRSKMAFKSTTNSPRWCDGKRDRRFSLDRRNGARGWACVLWWVAHLNFGNVE